MREWVGSAIGRQPFKREVLAAWVTFVGTGTVAIRDSHNVSSITDNGTGDYSVNWAVPFGYSGGATGYAVVGSNYISGGNAAGCPTFIGGAATEGNEYNVNFARMRTSNAGAVADANIVSVVAVGV